MGEWKGVGVSNIIQLHVHVRVVELYTCTCGAL